MIGAGELVVTKGSPSGCQIANLKRAKFEIWDLCFETSTQ
jgi:hypothetical protein